MYMYDFVADLIFDEETNIKNISLKSLLQSYGVKPTGKLPPHITIDLYENIDAEMLIATLNQFATNIKAFSFQFAEIGNFDNKVLFLRPDNIADFQNIKVLFDTYLGEYRIKNNANQGIYRPHLTLTSSEDITSSQTILENNFTPFDGNVAQICVYSKNKELIKRYDLK